MKASKLELRKHASGCCGLQNKLLRRSGSICDEGYVEEGQPETLRRGVKANIGEEELRLVLPFFEFGGIDQSIKRDDDSLITYLRVLDVLTGTSW